MSGLSSPSEIALCIRVNCLRPLPLVFFLYCLMLKPVRLRDCYAASGRLRDCRTQRKIRSARTKRRADKPCHNIADKACLCSPGLGPRKSGAD